MNWEAVSAVSTAFTGVVILFTVIYAAMQVRALNQQAKATAEQIDHLRRSTQLEGMHETFDKLLSPEFVDAYNFISGEFQERMKDESFRQDALTRTKSRSPAHKETVVCRMFESIGTCVKFGMIDGGPVYDFAGPMIIESWRMLEDLISQQRRAWNIPALWENFELLHRGALGRGYERTIKELKQDR